MGLPCDLADLKARITAAVKNIDAPMLTRVANILLLISLQRGSLTDRNETEGLEDTQSAAHAMFLHNSILPMAYGLVVLILFVR
jgi:hypothetical protein